MAPCRSRCRARPRVLRHRRCRYSLGLQFDGSRVSSNASPAVRRCRSHCGARLRVRCRRCRSSSSPQSPPARSSSAGARRWLPSPRWVLFTWNGTFCAGFHHMCHGGRHWHEPHQQARRADRSDQGGRAHVLAMIVPVRIVLVCLNAKPFDSAFWEIVPRLLTSVQARHRCVSKHKTHVHALGGLLPVEDRGRRPGTLLH